MKNIQLFNVAPSVPEPIAFLEKLSRNLWWCWNPEAIELFRRIDQLTWREEESNPVTFLSRIPQKQFEALTNDQGFVKHLAEVRNRFDAEVTNRPSLQDTRPCSCVGYFSLEFGIHESLRVYSGGLGLLAGDHLKAASDLGVPLVGVSLFYRQGYFQQFLDKDGMQLERYPENEVHRLPLRRVLTAKKDPLTVSVALPDGRLHAAVWQTDVGRVPLFLLDANVPENAPHHRLVTAQLYGGDRQTRLRQELLLGIGGFSALVELGYEPSVCHMNEGHAAFLSLARMRHLVKTRGITLDAAAEVTMRSSLFTTHTPVPAGNECFEVGLLRPYLDALRDTLDINPDQVIAWGNHPLEKEPRELSMTVLGLRMARYRNGVSRLHGEIARKMWVHLWPAWNLDEVPIGHVTNGIHVPSWLLSDLATLYDRYLGPEWRSDPSRQEVLSRIANIPDEELWRAREMGRARLIRSAREHMEHYLRVRNATRKEITQAKSALDHETLTIGFARRFATYKRATLLLRNMDRFKALLTDTNKPVQVIFAGKAHPADHAGKEFIRQIVQFSREDPVHRRVVFLENYDIRLARRLVQGADVWLNTPRRPLEASGTSGMKAAVNGVLNVSVLDGWWCEGYDKEAGWAVGRGEEYPDPEYQDSVDSEALYNVLENEVVPSFYDRSEGDIPARWTKMMRESIRMALGYFTSHRMVAEYNNYYTEAAAAFSELLAHDGRKARKLVEQRHRFQTLWGEISVGPPVCDRDISSLHVGDRFRITSRVFLGKLKPDDVDVEVCYGPVNSENLITRSSAELMSLREDRADGSCIYEHDIECRATGRYGFTTRVTPHGSEWKNLLPGFLTWADGVR